MGVGLFAKVQISAVLTVAAMALSGFGVVPASAQQAGDVGQDAGGNVYTYLVENGQGRWVRGRVGTGGTERTILAERYIPNIWIDPDGCEHWVMDDGSEGFMSPHVDRHGRPVCH